MMYDSWVFTNDGSIRPIEYRENQISTVSSLYLEMIIIATMMMVVVMVMVLTMKLTMEEEERDNFMLKDLYFIRDSLRHVLYYPCILLTSLKSEKFLSDIVKSPLAYNIESVPKDISRPVQPQPRVLRHLCHIVTNDVVFLHFLYHNTTANELSISGTAGRCRTIVMLIIARIL